MTWDAKKFMAEYLEGECDNTRCRNRREQAMDTAKELRDAQAILRKVMQRAKQDPSSPVARDIYQAVADYNLGHRDGSAAGVETLELPSAPGRTAPSSSTTPSTT